MQVTFKQYKRRDGSTMLYINGSNGCSIGVSSERGFSPYGKDGTQGKRNLWRAACNIVSEKGATFTGDLSKHHETGFCAPVRLENGWTIVGTDTATIGGMQVDGDGGYLIVRGRILHLGQTYSEVETVDVDEEDV